MLFTDMLSSVDSIFITNLILLKFINQKQQIPTIIYCDILCTKSYRSLINWALSWSDTDCKVFVIHCTFPTSEMQWGEQWCILNFFSSIRNWTRYPLHQSHRPITLRYAAPQYSRVFCCILLHVCLTFVLVYKTPREDLEDLNWAIFTSQISP